MKVLTSFIVLNTGEGERISFTYSEVGEDGTIISQNNKKNFLVLNKDLKNHISEIKKYIEDTHLTETE
ncbi:hypothetical protein [Blautia massiliensis (ex Durand et al. 2017)]|uniref:hypothetical protein n=1 Tax=Blautia massiliensis (ex Durand et al. 2017) TaxID=1737424 RepID=UPI0022E80763|nr:hypothetical protein [Blautia massiliensis (ex Durand et al. 2017)]